MATKRWKLKRQGRDYPRVVDQDENVLAMVVSNELEDGCLMAAAPELYDRLDEVRHLKSRTHDGKRKLLLPPEALAAIDKALRNARPSK